MPSTSLVNLRPPQCLRNEVFPLKEAHIVQLQKHAYSGMRLPTTVENYCKEFDLTSETLNKIQLNVDEILEVHSEIREHSINFKEHIVRGMVDLAFHIYNYAGGAERFYYAIYEAVVEIDHITNLPHSSENRAKIERNKTRVNALVDEQLPDIDKMSEAAEKVVECLKKFEIDTRSDQTKSERMQSNLDALFGNDDGEFAMLSTKLEDMQEVIGAHQKTYKETLDKIARIAKWGWIPLFGWIAATILSSIWNNRAEKLADAMAAISNEMGGIQAELTSCRNVVAQGISVNAHLKNMIKLIEPTIKTVQVMQGSFPVIADELKSIKGQMGQNGRDATSIVADISIDSVVADWASMRECADLYRLSAFVVPFEGKVG